MSCRGQQSSSACMTIVEGYKSLAEIERQRTDRQKTEGDTERQRDRETEAESLTNRDRKIT